MVHIIRHKKPYNLKRFHGMALTQHSFGGDSPHICEATASLSGPTVLPKIIKTA